MRSSVVKPGVGSAFCHVTQSRSFCIARPSRIAARAMAMPSTRSADALHHIEQRRRVEADDVLARPVVVAGDDAQQGQRLAWHIAARRDVLVARAPAAPTRSGVTTELSMLPSGLSSAICEAPSVDNSSMPRSLSASSPCMTKARLRSQLAQQPRHKIDGFERFDPHHLVVRHGRSEQRADKVDRSAEPDLRGARAKKVGRSHVTNAFQAQMPTRSMPAWDVRLAFDIDPERFDHIDGAAVGRVAREQWRTTYRPHAAATIAAAVLMLNVFSVSPPVPALSMIGSGVSIATFVVSYS